MNKKCTDIKKFKRSKTKRTGKYKNQQVNGPSGSVEKPTSLVLTEARSRKVSKIKNTSNGKPQKQPEPIDHNILKDQNDGRNSLSSNWKEFLKEVGKQKRQADQKALRTGQKRKPFEKYGISSKVTNKRRKENEEESIMVDNSVLNVNDIWFDDVDIEDIELAAGKRLTVNNDKNERSDSVPDASSNADMDSHDHKSSITKRLGIDCEMVGVGVDGKESMLARVSIVNSFGDTVYDTFVAPMQTVVDYRTEFSGVRPQDLVNAPTFKDVQRIVANITDGKILVGHAIRNDLKALLLSHSRKNIRDTSTYKPFKKLLRTPLPSLKRLTKEILNIDIQSGEHSSVEDAKYTMRIYQLHKKKWEKSLKDKGYKDVLEDYSKIFMGRNPEYHKKRFKRMKRIQRQRMRKRKS